MENLYAEEEVTKAFEKLYRETSDYSDKDDHSDTTESTKVNHKLPQDGQAERTKSGGVHCQTGNETDANAVVYIETDNNQVKGETHRNGMVAVPSTVDMAMKEEGCTLSFSQILQFVQNGQEIPGTRNLDIIPNNLPLTVSQMARKHKPWETA